MSMAVKIAAWQNGGHYYNRRQFNLSYKSGKNSGDFQHCVFGCLMTVVSPAFLPFVGGTELTKFQWGDLVSDYQGALFGLTSFNLDQCVAKCRGYVCCGAKP